MSEECQFFRFQIVKTGRPADLRNRQADQKLKGKPGNIQKALAQRPEILKTFLPFYASVGRSLGHKLYELIYIRVSMLNRCHY